MNFTGNSEFPINIRDFSFPLQFFKYFLNSDLIDHIVYGTTLKIFE